MPNDGLKDLRSIYHELNDASAMVHATACALGYAVSDLEDIASTLDSDTRERMKRALSLLHVAREAMDDQSQRVSEAAAQLHSPSQTQKSPA
jgi:hypothetical protein